MADTLEPWADPTEPPSCSILQLERTISSIFRAGESKYHFPTRLTQRAIRITIEILLVSGLLGGSQGERTNIAMGHQDGQMALF
jgi:hypothetical protein